MASTGPITNTTELEAVVPNLTANEASFLRRIMRTLVATPNRRVTTGGTVWTLASLLASRSTLPLTTASMALTGIAAFLMTLVVELGVQGAGRVIYNTIDRFHGAGKKRSRDEQEQLPTEDLEEVQALAPTELTSSVVISDPTQPSTSSSSSSNEVSVTPEPVEISDFFLANTSAGPIVPVTPAFTAVKEDDSETRDAKRQRTPNNNAVTPAVESIETADSAASLSDDAPASSSPARSPKRD